MDSRGNGDQRAFARTMGSLEAGLLVEHVASDITSADASQPVTAVRAWATQSRFNNVPVRRQSHVVDVLENLLHEVEG
jgi:hypothetical protein